MIRQVLIIAALAVGLVATSHAGQPAFTKELGVAGLSCQGCADTATKALQSIPGVTSARVDLETKRARIEARSEVTDEQIRAALAKFGFEAEFSADDVVKPLTAAERSRLDIKVASNGEKVDIRKHLAKGKYTIFDFWAEWCGPCHVLTPKLERLVQQNDNVALRTLDLKNWDSALAKQATNEFELPGLPYVRVYGPDGKFVGAVVGNDIEKIEQLLK